jgi:dUTP pyrophosphatase
MQHELQVKIVDKSEHFYGVPQYETEHSAGMDLRANLVNLEKGIDVYKVYLNPGERKLIPTGLFIELPIGYEAQIRPRSGLAFKHGITVLNSPGTIDADYRLEVKVLLVNTSNEPFVIEHGERIAQMVVAKHERVEWDRVVVLSESNRSGGFGSTGTK